MNLEIKSGPWIGHRIARARKAGKCEYGRCAHIIQVGDHYVQGELNPYKAGGFAQDRYCMDCAGPEAREVLHALSRERLGELVGTVAL